MEWLNVVYTRLAIEKSLFGSLYLEQKTISLEQCFLVINHYHQPYQSCHRLPLDTVKYEYITTGHLELPFLNAFLFVFLLCGSLI